MRRRSKARIYLSIAVYFGLVAAACGSGSEQTETVPGSETDVAAPLTSPTADGGQFDWNSVEGQDTVLWFWAPW